MGNAPAKELVVCGPLGEKGDGTSHRHAATRAVTDADVVPGGVHKGSRKHGHTPDILAREHVVVLVHIVNALGLFADGHNIFPG